MSDTGNHGKPKPARDWWLLVEICFYVIPGVFVLSVAMHAVVRWSLQYWLSGDRISAGAVAWLMAIVLFSVIFATRKHKLAQLIVFLVCGAALVLYLLALFGLGFPASWFP